MATTWLLEQQATGLDIEVLVLAPDLELAIEAAYRGPNPLSVGRSHPREGCAECAEASSTSGSGARGRLDVSKPEAQLGRLSRHHFDLVHEKPYTLRVINRSRVNRLLVNGERVDDAVVWPGDIVKAGTHSFWIRRIGDRRSPEKRRCGWCGCGYDVEARVAAPGFRREDQWYCQTCHQVASSAPEDLGGNYRIEGWVGGGMGNVFRARHTMLNQVRALKVMRPELSLQAWFRERFFREIAAHGEASKHPGVVALHEAGETRSGVLYMVMQFVEGSSLEGLIRENGPLLPQDAIVLFEQLLDVLEHLESHGLVHRDLKPANLLITREERLLLTDFGLSKIKLEDAHGIQASTRNGVMMGTVPYAAPEQLLNAKDADHRADLYGAGAVLYSLLAGVHPLEHLPMENWLGLGGSEGTAVAGSAPTGSSTRSTKKAPAFVKEPPLPLHRARKGIPMVLCRYVERLLENDREDRPASARQAREELKAVKGGV